MIRRLELIKKNVWLTRHSEEIPLAEMTDTHVERALVWCKRWQSRWTRRQDAEDRWEKVSLYEEEWNPFNELVDRLGAEMRRRIS